MNAIKNYRGIIIEISTFFISALKKTLLILEPVTKACPGLRDALFLLAKARYLAGDIKAAVGTLQHVVDNLDPTLAEAHLLMAQIQLHQVIFNMSI